MQGVLVNYSWLEFTEDFQFKSGYYLAGQTMRVLPERLSASKYRNIQTFDENLGLFDEPVENIDLIDSRNYGL
jgi:hypothetical protein